MRGEASLGESGRHQHVGAVADAQTIHYASVPSDVNGVTTTRSAADSLRSAIDTAYMGGGVNAENTMLVRGYSYNYIGA